jgi:signal transduction histidine kinase
MRRFLPRSLAGQMALLFALALLVAQLANFALLLNEREKLSLARNEAPALTVFARTFADLSAAAPEFGEAVAQDASRRGARFAIAAAPQIARARDTELEGRLREAMAQAGAPSATVHAIRDEPREAARPGDPGGGQLLRVEAPTRDGRWLSARLYLPRPDPFLPLRLAAATLILFALVLGASIWIAVRIARPLRDLTRAADRFGDDAVIPRVEPSGPDDVRQAMLAFNAMNERVAGLLEEKDLMLGAMGHDLRTPLASLRIRLEGMEPEEDRAAAVAKIEEITAMLEDILVLARSARVREDLRTADLPALVEALVDDYADMGSPVRFAPSPRILARVQPDLLRRAIRNLVDNAVNYGGAAEVSVVASGDGIEIRVADSGPGLPADEMAKVLRPFYRVEGSRNRATGGSGLGLAIASNIAAQHGGALRLERGDPAGLVAVIRLPALSAA